MARSGRAAQPAAVVGITDRAGWSDVRTDNLVVVRPWRRELLWIPRDVWSPLAGDRINRAFERGGFPRLLAALWYLGLPVGHGVVLSRAATERLAERLDVRVPVAKPMRFRYPIEPTRPIREGEKVIAFDPPEERLTGERLHQWIGARYALEGPGSDLGRITRQQVLLRELLRRGVPLGSVLERPDEVRRFGAPERVLRRVEPGWDMRTLQPLVDESRDGAQILVTPGGLRRLQARVLRSRR
jgi:anionic cell wall polymer biosynthesis LytR-Cps2A-Psr (LCP) family protein